MAEIGEEYKVGRLSKVAQQLPELLEIATKGGFRKLFFDALFKMVHYLKTRPLEWGDPKNRTQKKGGLICQAILAPFNVHYVVFEIERSVCILDIELLPNYRN